MPEDKASINNQQHGPVAGDDTNADRGREEVVVNATSSRSQTGVSNRSSEDQQAEGGTEGHRDGVPSDLVVLTDQNDYPSSPKMRNLFIVAVIALVALVAIYALFLRGRASERPTNASEAKAGGSEGAGHDEEGGEIKLSSTALVSAGVEIEGVTSRPAVALLRVTGTVETNQQQTQGVTPLVGGRVERVNVTLGDRVKAGAVLAIITSPEIAEMRGKVREAETRLELAERNLQRVQRAENRVAVLQAKARLDAADATLRRTRRLIELGAGAGKDLIAAEADYRTAKAEHDFQSNISLNREVAQAQAEVQTARVDASHLRQSLVSLGAHMAENGGNTGGNISLLPVRAPASGTVTQRLVNPGAGVEAGEAMFTIANISTMWVIASVPEAQIGLLHPGTPAEVISAALGGGPIRGRVGYIDPQLDEGTRTARVRIEVSNPGERLKAGMFVEVGFQAGKAGGSGEELMIPSASIQRTGDRNIVFVPREGEQGVFEARAVELGGESDGYTSVKSGLELGDKVVTKGSFTLKTQMMKGEMGDEH